ncbi:MAG: EamA family transporter [Firmicutes bacterium]|nr:EamA family transporter [Bacillota bacterium]
MWIVFAVGSAFFAGITSILAKAGLANTDSDLVTALRTIVVLLFAWLMAFVSGATRTLFEVSGQSLLFLALSGVTTGASWLCYFRALQMGDVNKVVPIDKSSTILTMLLAFAVLAEPIGWAKAAAMALIGAGTLMMARQGSARAETNRPRGMAWAVYALLSAVFAALTAILGKLGIAGVASDLGTALRTIVVLAMAWLIVFLRGKQKRIYDIDRRNWWFILLSGLATGLSWLCYYRALWEGPASVVVPIDKLSILCTTALAWVFFREKLTLRAGVGLALMTVGTVLLVVI